MINEKQNIVNNGIKFGHNLQVLINREFIRSAYPHLDDRQLDDRYEQIQEVIRRCPEDAADIFMRIENDKINRQAIYRQYGEHSAGLYACGVAKDMISPRLAEWN